MPTPRIERRPASARAQLRLAAMVEEVRALVQMNYFADDLPDRGLVRSLIADVHHELDRLERRLGLLPVEVAAKRRA